MQYAWETFDDWMNVWEQPEMDQRAGKQLCQRWHTCHPALTLAQSDLAIRTKQKKTEVKKKKEEEEDKGEEEAACTRVQLLPLPIK